MLLYYYTYLDFTVWNCWLYRYMSILSCYSTTILASTSPSEIADYIVTWVYYYATLLLYLRRLHRLKLLIISLYEYIIKPLYYYTYLDFTVWNCWLYRCMSVLLCCSTTIPTSTSPSEIADYVVIWVYYYATLVLYLPRLHRLKWLTISLYEYITTVLCQFLVGSRAPPAAYEMSWLALLAATTDPCTNVPVDLSHD